MPKFFIPGNHSAARAEEIYEWIVQFVTAMTDSEVEPARIYSLDYMYEGQRFTTTVGEVDSRTTQLVIAILRSPAAYLICTPYYGVRRGEPIKIGLADVRGVQYFYGLDDVRERFRAAVETLDGGAGTIQSRVHAAALTLSSLFVDDFPPRIVADFVSLNHKLGWRGSLDETVHGMSDSEATDAVATVRALYVDVLSLAPVQDRATE